MFFFECAPSGRTIPQEPVASASPDGHCYSPTAGGDPMGSLRITAPRSSDIISFGSRGERALDIDRIDLPPSLERSGGTIRVTGHRVSLFLILDAYFKGKSIDELRDLYPTIPPRKLWCIFAFIGAHIEAMRSYHLETRASDAAMKKSHVTKLPSSEDLRARWKVKFGKEFGA